MFGLDPESFCMTDQDRHANARRTDREVRELEDLARLGPDLRFLVELDSVEGPVHPEVVFLYRLSAESVHRRCTGTGHRLVRRHAHTAESRGVPQWSERHRQWDRAAVRVGDDSVVLVCPIAVHLGHDERNAVLEPESGGLVDAECSSCGGNRNEPSARGRSDGEEAEVEIPGAQHLWGRFLYRQATERGAG